MNDLEKEFVPHEEALVLNELGFDEPCLSYFEDKNLIYGVLNDIGKKRYLVVPLYQQAFRWFREKYKLVTWIYCSNESNGYFAIILAHKRLVLYDAQFNTYEEAELACLKKLIKTVKDDYKM